MKYISESIRKLDSTIHAARVPQSKKVHQLRVCTKRLRSLWRLVRRQIGETAYNRENLRLREIAHRFGERRDQEIILKLVQDLIKKNHGDQLFAEFGMVEKRVGKKLRRRGTRPNWDKLLSEIKESADRLARLKFKPGWLKKQVKLSLHQAEKQLAKCARERPNTEDFHRWRRRSKNLMYQIEFINSLGVRFADVRLRDLKTLTDGLGKAHDYQVLYDYLEKARLSRLTLKKALSKKRQLERKSVNEGLRMDLH